MKKLIEALTIFSKYTDSEWPTHCEHDILMICNIEEDDLSEADRKRVQELHFFWSTEYNCYASFHYGSA